MISAGDFNRDDIENPPRVRLVSCDGTYETNSDRLQTARFEILRDKQGNEIGTQLKYCLYFNMGDKTCDNCNRDYVVAHSERLRCRYADIYNPKMSKFNAT
jgi:hypothetical protein